MFVLNITSSTDRRSLTGILSQLTWDLEEGPCLYVGDIQGSYIREIEEPNDGVIEGLYSDYRVSGRFVEDFVFGSFDEEKCN